MIEDRVKIVEELAHNLKHADNPLWNKAISNSCKQNPWFTSENIRTALSSYAQQLRVEEVNRWLFSYSFQFSSQKKVAIIMAGNIPMVGFNDLLCVLMSGHKAMVKLSSKDRFLIPVIIDILKQIDPTINEDIQVVNKLDKSFDAVIATGSNHSFRQFQYYFKDMPKILRKSRTSVAVLDGSESLKDKKALANDVFLYFGLGCRNVTKLYLPSNYKLDTLFEAFDNYKEIIFHNKYANNYHYHKAIFSMAKTSFLDNGFLLLKEDESLHSPVSVLHYEYYENQNALFQKIKAQNEHIQCIVGRNNTPFGQAQFPKLEDYADGVDTLSFLATL